MWVHYHNKGKNDQHVADMILYVKCGDTFSRNSRQHVIVRHRMLETVEKVAFALK